MMSPKKPTIAVGTLGGTITMTAVTDGTGVQPSLGAEQLFASIPGLSQYVDKLYLQTLNTIASGSLRFSDLFAALRWAIEQVNQGADGVILVQGTDTLEESAYFMDLYWPFDQPLILTGAMRSADEVGAEGAANLLAAVITAGSEAARAYGALVLMNDEIHQSRYVRKVHTTALNAFASPVVGPVGAVLEHRVQLFRAPIARHVFPIPDQHEARVMLIETTLDDDPSQYRSAVSLGHQGLVVAGVGSGHVSVPVRHALAEVLTRIPVLMASRTGAGSTTQSLYSYPGSEVDLQNLGVVMTGYLCPRKARLLLLASLWQGLTGIELQETLLLASGS